MAKKNHSEFVVKLDGIRLGEESEKRIEKGIQSLVLQELAGYKPNPDDPDNPGFPHHGRGGAVVVVPIKWPGYWIKILSEIEFNKIGNVINVKEIGNVNLG